MRIEGIQNPALAQQLGGVGKKTEDFGQMLMDVLKEVNETQNKSAQLNNASLTGQPGVEIHDVKMAAEKASIAMSLTIQVRNKVLEAYQEISRMQV
ncbi:MAG: flagellar hook-basal body complex protein FliE [Armatimonadetes bacterium]|jgi:flagellar hook-basal body complex protein FliE|nr:flagellar hook-basal body complex protein FliE [Armatimonadota bacterium]